MPQVSNEQLFKPYLTSDRPNYRGEWRGQCPLCQGPVEPGPYVGTEADATFNFDLSLFNCFRGACGWGGTLAQLKRRMEEEDLPLGEAVTADSGPAYDAHAEGEPF
jgi:hypothetical protein